MLPPMFSYKCSVRVPAQEVYRAFTRATALRDWLCDAAQADARKGGRLYLWWQSGYFVNGEYDVADPGKRVVFAWRGPEDPAATIVRVVLSAQKGATRVTLTHEGVGVGPRWNQTVQHIQKDWPASLENLKSVLETGQDLRAIRHPITGITGGSEHSAHPQGGPLGPARAGIRVNGVIAGLAAATAGLQAGDVLVGLDGHPVTGWATYRRVLEGHQAGDAIEVVYWRGDRKLKGELTLSPHPITELPPDAAALAARAREIYAGVYTTLAAAIAGLAEKDAEQRPAPGEWNVKELVAHFIACERDLQAWIAAMLNDGNRHGELDETLEYRPNVAPRLAALVAVRPSLPMLLGELQCSQAETVALLAGLPGEFVARKPYYRRVAEWIEHTSVHLSDHRGQLEALVKEEKSST